MSGARKLQPAEAFAGMLLFPRGRWGRACPCLTYLHPRNSLTAENARIAMARGAA